MGGIDKGIDKAGKYFPSWLPPLPSPFDQTQTENGSFNETGDDRLPVQRSRGSNVEQIIEGNERGEMAGFRCRHPIDDEKENRKGEEGEGGGQIL